MKWLRAEVRVPRRRMGTGQALYPDIRKERNLRRKALFPARQFYLVLCRIGVILQPEVYGLSVGLHPVGSGCAAELIVQRNLLQRLSVAEYHASPV